MIQYDDISMDGWNFEKMIFVRFVSNFIQSLAGFVNISISSWLISKDFISLNSEVERWPRLRIQRRQADSEEPSEADGAKATVKSTIVAWHFVALHCG